jgi:hypothetical protein
MDMLEDTSATRLLMTPLVCAVIGTLASALVLFLQAVRQQNRVQPTCLFTAGGNPNASTDVEQ